MNIHKTLVFYIYKYWEYIKKTIVKYKDVKKKLIYYNKQQKNYLNFFIKP